jgi:hypothetical protein
LISSIADVTPTEAVPETSASLPARHSEEAGNIRYRAERTVLRQPLALNDRQGQRWPIWLLS